MRFLQRILYQGLESSQERKRVPWIIKIQTGNPDKRKRSQVRNHARNQGKKLIPDIWLEVRRTQILKMMECGRVRRNQKRTLSGKAEAKASKDPKFHLDNVSGPDIKRKDYDFGFKDTVTLTRTERGSEAVDQKSEDRFQSQQMPGEDRDTLKTRKKDEKISSKNEVRRGRVKKEQENTRMKKAIRRRMYAFMVNKLSGEEQKDSFAKAAKDIAVMRAGLVVKQLVLYLLGLLGPLLGGWLRLLAICPDYCNPV